MAKTRKLGGTERLVGWRGSERSRDRADARRQIEGLGQNDQIIALLSSIDSKLAWLCDETYRRSQADGSQD